MLIDAVIIEIITASINIKETREKMVGVTALHTSLGGLGSLACVLIFLGESNTS
jgi:hypothetical protein